MGNLLCKHLHMLNPLKMEVMVEHSLSPWYKDIPLVDVRLYVYPVKVSLEFYWLPFCCDYVILGQC